MDLNSLLGRLKSLHANLQMVYSLRNDAESTIFLFSWKVNEIWIA